MCVGLVANRQVVDKKGSVRGQRMWTLGVCVGLITIGQVINKKGKVRGRHKGLWGMCAAQLDRVEPAHRSAPLGLSSRKERRIGGVRGR
eukprot:293932-Chlamydomonas_euryale.AAC.2